MLQDVPAGKVLGLGVFETGCVTLAWSIYNIIPRGQEVVMDATLLGPMMVNMLVIVIASLLISAGMFFVIYGDDLFAHH